MSGARFRPNSREIRRFLKGPEVEAMIAAHTREVQNAAGEGFESRVRQGPNRVYGSVIAWTVDAKRRQSRDHALERALGRLS